MRGCCAGCLRGCFQQENPLWRVGKKGLSSSVKYISGFGFESRSRLQRAGMRRKEQERNQSLVEQLKKAVHSKKVAFNRLLARACSTSKTSVASGLLVLSSETAYGLDRSYPMNKEVASSGISGQLPLLTPFPPDRSHPNQATLIYNL